jgi:hypothetical protein
MPLEAPSSQPSSSRRSAVARAGAGSPGQAHRRKPGLGVPLAAAQRGRQDAGVGPLATATRAGSIMNDETFNLEIRKFLKRFGVSSQRAIEEAVRDGLDSGRLRGSETLRVEARLVIRDLDTEHSIDDEIRLE